MATSRKTVMLFPLLVFCAIWNGASCCRTLSTEGGTQTSERCVLPFEFDGWVYTSCTDVGDPDGKKWCSTEVDSSGVHVSGEGKWGHCDLRSCAFENTNRKAPGGTCTGSGCCGTNVVIDREKAGIRLAPGAESAIVGAWPWMVSAGYFARESNKWNHQCGGTVITKTHALTAAHCALADGADRWTLIFGDTDINSRSDDVDVATRTIQRTTIHPKYKSSEPYYDVALWEFPPVTFGLFIRPICLPQGSSTDEEAHTAKAAETMGWGVVGKGSLQPSNILRSTSLRIYQQRYCNDTFGEYPNKALVRERYPRLFSDGLMCAGAPTGNRGTCFGDSGGPLVLEEVYPRRRYVQLGIVQGGIGKCGSAHYPDAFVRLEDPDVFNFIMEKIGRVVPTTTTTRTTTTTVRTTARRTPRPPSPSTPAPPPPPPTTRRSSPPVTRSSSPEILLLGGYRDADLDEVEVFSLGGSSCRDPRDLPHVRYGTMVHPSFPGPRDVTVCGGQTDFTMLNTCLVYSADTDNWRKAPFQLNDQRKFAAWVLLNGGDTMMVFGGRQETDGGELSTTEIMSRNDRSFHYGPSMPYAAIHLCAVAVNSTHVFMSGGSYDDEKVPWAYLLDTQTDYWTRVLDMSVARSGHACGLVNGAYVVVAGGYGPADFQALDSVEIFSLATLSWTRGWPMPHPAIHMGAVQVGNDIVTTGGYYFDANEERAYLDEVYRFNGATYTWTRLPQRLRMQRAWHAAVLLPTENFDFC